MNELVAKLETLEPDHRDALSWFWDRRGQEIPWTETLDERVFLMNRAKGIHKPKGWRHVLSVRETLSSAYADEKPVEHADGSWTYRYFQEGADPTSRDRDFTNRAMLACADDGVPVAVLRQTAASPTSKYRVLGLARVGQWSEGYFTLHGYAEAGAAAATLAAVNETSIAEAGTSISLEDARRRIEASLVQRQGGRAFRARLLEAYEGRCAVTGCDAIEALEAAHVVPYLGAHTDVLENGILLRADLHTLFDRMLLRIDPLSLRVGLVSALRQTTYAGLEGKVLHLPKGVKAAEFCKRLVARRELLESGLVNV